MFSDLLKKLEIENIPEGLSEYWDESQSSFSGEAFYLKKEFLQHLADVIEMNDDLKKAYYDTAEKILENEAASRFAWFLYFVYCVKKVVPTNELPVPSRKVLGPNERMFVFIVLSPLADELEKNFES